MQCRLSPPLDLQVLAAQNSYVPHSKKNRSPTANDEKQNLTLRVGTGALRVARTLAAREGVSLSQLFEQLAEEREGRRVARDRIRRELLELGERGLRLDGSPYLTRDDAHER